MEIGHVHPVLNAILLTSYPQRYVRTLKDDYVFGMDVKLRIQARALKNFK